MSTNKNGNNPLSFKHKNEAAEALEPFFHTYCGGALCETDSVGYSSPDGRSPAELVVDASGGFIPLWTKNVTLRWRFQKKSMAQFQNPDGAKEYLRGLFAEGILSWKDSPPIKFTEARDNWDFEVVVSPEEKCSPNGCVLASAFFPDAGRHELRMYPTLFNQSRIEQVETMAHELGHVFGLRHFFAKISEKKWRSEIFGKHSPFSIMNYGKDSRLTKSDISDLKKLYELAWSGELKEINGTRIQLVRPFSTLNVQKLQPNLAAFLT